MFQKTVFKFNDGNSCPDYSGFNFGAAQEPKDGKIKLVSSTHTCREGLFHNMRSRINQENADQPTDKMRMIFRWYSGKKASQASYLEQAEQWALRSAEVLRVFDRCAGWPLTRVYQLDVGKKSDWLRAYYYWSSRRWMKASYLVSLYVLLVRMCKDERITGFKNIDELVKLVKTTDKLKNDNHYAKYSAPYWKSIMKGYPDLFMKRKMTYYWDTARVGGSGGSEGVQYLCNGDTSYTEVRTRLLTIKKAVDAGKYKPGTLFEKKKKSK